MPPLPLADHVWRIAPSLQVATNHSAGVRFFWKYAGSAKPAVGEAEQLATYVRNGWSEYLAPMMPGTNALQSVLVQDLTYADGAQGIDTVQVNGTRAGNALPQDTCALITFNIARRYRGGKPRMYFPGGVAADAADERTWQQAFRDELNAAWTSFKTYMNSLPGLSFTMVDHYNVGYYSGVLPPTTLPSGRVKQANKVLTTPNIDAITGHQVAAVFGSQRRRLAT